MHAFCTLSRCLFIARVAGNVSVKLQDGLLLDHHPCDPCISEREQHEQTNDGSRSKGKELHAECKGKKDTRSEGIDVPFQSHAVHSQHLYLMSLPFVPSKVLNHGDLPVNQKQDFIRSPPDTQTSAVEP